MWRAQDWSFEDKACFECVLNTTKADKLQYLGQSLGAVLPVVGLSLLPVLCEKVADLVLLASALLRNFEGRLLLPAHDRLPCAVPFHCVDELGSLSARDVEKVKRSSGSTLGWIHSCGTGLRSRFQKHAPLTTLRVVPRNTTQR